MSVGGKPTRRVPAIAKAGEWSGAFSLLLMLSSLQLSAADCDQPIGGGRGDLLFCLSRAPTVLDHQGFKLLVPAGWYYGSNDHGVKVQNAPIGENSALTVRLSGPVYEDNKVYWQSLGLTCVETGNNKRACSGSHNGIFVTHHFLRLDDGWVYAYFDFPMHMFHQSFEPLSSVLESIEAE